MNLPVVAAPVEDEAEDDQRDNQPEGRQQRPGVVVGGGPYLFEPAQRCQPDRPTGRCWNR